MPDSLIEKLNKVRNPASWFIGIAVFIFTTGVASAGYFGLPDRISSLEQDNIATICLLVAMLEERDGNFCTFLLSDDTRSFINDALSEDFTFPGSVPPASLDD